MNDLILLAMLLDGPQHGYALKKKVGLVTGQGEMHNNLVYPLLKRFVAQGWVSWRSAHGQRGRTREMYALTAKGKKELLRRLGDFAEKDAGSPSSFRLRVSLFRLLDPATRQTILLARAAWLTMREQNLARISEALGAQGWAADVLDFMKAEIHAERRWVEHLRRKAAAPNTGKLRS
jgi:DNA-binding PadR family transcriptional regulator